MTPPEPPSEAASASQPGDRHDRFPPPTVGGWCSDARDDHITGLVAWPGFFARLPGLVERSLTGGRPVGLAIGDVDNLKDYVEGGKAVDAQSFGHLAGNALMGRLGTIARHWLWTDGPATACLATFGGDEVVLVAETDSVATFLTHVAGLRDHLCRGLPRTVSFGVTVLTPEALPGAVSGDHWWREYVVFAIGAVERSLFDGKHTLDEMALANSGSSPRHGWTFAGRAAIRRAVEQTAAQSSTAGDHIDERRPATTAHRART